MTALDEAALVCPRCGTPADDNAFCAGCGLNLRRVDELPTAEAYAAQQREKTWLARQETDRGEQREAARLRTVSTDAEAEHAPEQATEAPSDPEPNEDQPLASRSRPRGKLVAALAAFALLAVGSIAVAVLALGGDEAATEAQSTNGESEPSAGTSATGTDQGAPADDLEDDPPPNPSGSSARDADADRASPSSQAAIEAAEAVLAEEGYEPVNFDFYDPEALMQVVVGVKADGGGACPGELAFFFVRNDFIGTDTSDPSCDVGIQRVEENIATLTYAIFEPGDPLCCPSGGQAEVRYEWIDSTETLKPLDPIPPQFGPETDGR